MNSGDRSKGSVISNKITYSGEPSVFLSQEEVDQIISDFDLGWELEEMEEVVEPDFNEEYDAFRR